MKNTTKRDKYLELRNICLIEPETDEFLQMTYLCKVDASFSEKDFLEVYKDLRGISLAKDTSFMRKLGIYPVSLLYEKKGHVMRAKENDMSEFDFVEGNLYKTNNRDIKGLLSVYNKKSAA